MNENLFETAKSETGNEAAPLTQAAPFSARKALEAPATEIEDLFGFGSAPVKGAVQESEAGAESGKPASYSEIENPTPGTVRRVKHTPTRSSMVWLWISLATVANISIAGVVVMRFESKTSRLLNRLDSRPSGEESITAPGPAADAGHGPVDPDPNASESTEENHSKPSAIEPPVNPNHGASGLHDRPDSVKVSAEPAVNNSTLTEASTLFDKGRFAEARKRYFQVLLSPMPQLDGKDAIAAKLGVARCLAREGVSNPAYTLTSVKREHK